MRSVLGATRCSESNTIAASSILAVDNLRRFAMAIRREHVAECPETRAPRREALCRGHNVPEFGVAQRHCSSVAKVHSAFPQLRADRNSSRRDPRELFVYIRRDVLRPSRNGTCAPTMSKRDPTRDE